MANKDQLLSLLAHHQGEAQGITSEGIATALDTNKREVRKLVTELRLSGVAVCGHPADGYYVAATPEELERTCQFLRSRAMRSLTLESMLRNVPLPDLLGQLHLRT
jgi:biotin operon repressor